MAAIYLDMLSAAEEAGLCIRYFRDIILETKPRLPVFKIGRKQFVLRTELNKWVAANKEVTYHGRN